MSYFCDIYGNIRALVVCLCVVSALVTIISLGCDDSYLMKKIGFIWFIFCIFIGNSYDIFTIKRIYLWGVKKNGRYW